MPRRFAVTLLVTMPEGQSDAFALAEEISRATSATFLVDGESRTVQLSDVMVYSDPASAVPTWRQEA